VSAVSRTIVSVELVEEAGESGLEAVESSILGRYSDVESDALACASTALWGCAGSAPDAYGASGKQ
jgi:hypothetical protein